MLLPRRLAAAAPRQLSRRAQSISSLSRTCRPYTSEAASAATQEAVDEPTTTPAKTKTATSATTTTSKWAKPKTAAKTSAATLSTSAASKRTAAALPSDVLYQPKTIAHTATSDVAPQEAVGVPVIDWANSFHGISSKPVTEEQFKVLMQPINEKDIEVKPDGVIYLPEIKYRRRLNEAFGPMGWGMIPKGEPVVGNTIVTREYALIVGGRFVSQAQGENGFFSPDQLPSAVEGCKSNALMRCCKDLGIGSELWDPHFVRWFKKTRMEEAWVEHTTTKKKRTFWYRKGEVDVAYPYKLAK